MIFLFLSLSLEICSTIEDGNFPLTSNMSSALIPAKSILKPVFRGSKLIVDKMPSACKKAIGSAMPHAEAMSILLLLKNSASFFVLINSWLIPSLPGVAVKPIFLVLLDERKSIVFSKVSANDM